jgi:hypothetical protein
MFSVQRKFAASVIGSEFTSGHKLYLQYYLGSVADLQGRGVKIFESRSNENISTPLSCQSVTDSK